MPYDPDDLLLDPAWDTEGFAEPDPEDEMTPAEGGAAWEEDL